MKATIHEYTPSDKEAINGVILNGLKEFGFSYSPTLDNDLDDPYKYYIEKGGMFYVLTVDRKVVGTIAIINKGEMGELKRLYLDKKYHGKGLGSLLFDTALQFCKDKGFKKVEFETNKKFTKAHLLYKKRGFKIIREDDESYYMEKEL